jgi:stearoyl-CoA desaturase (delta-9 desaturase)
LIASVSEKVPLNSADGAELVPVHAEITMLLVVILPFLGLIAGIALLWGHGFSWAQLGVFLGMYFLTALGITVGYHRLFTHRAFEATRPVKLILALLGSMAVEGSLCKWVATHRLHHNRSDTPDDPHSPNLYGNGILATLRGFWHAHVGWMFDADSPNLSRYVRDLLPDRLLCAVSKLFPLWAVVGLLIPTLLGGLLTWSWFGALVGFVWGGLARVFLVHHVTFSINSVCHLWGRRPFRTQDQSRNNLVFGVVGLGEGWHNNHHAFPNSARHGLKWWQIDVSYLVIRLLEMLRLARNVRTPQATSIARRQQMAV